MVDAIISVVVNLLSNKLIKEVDFMRDVRHQFKQLEKESIRMECLLKHVDEMEEGNEMTRNWVSEIREAAFDTQDIIETYMLKLEDKNKTSTSRGFKATFNKISLPACIVGKGMKLQSIGKDMRAIHDRLRDLKKDQDPLQLSLGESRKKPKLDRRTSSIPEEDFIGLEDIVNTLVTKLTGGEVNRCVISIVGMGGLGKTALARYLYNHNNIQSHFDCCGWVSVTQEYKTEDLLRTIINSIIINMQTREDEKKMNMTLTMNDLEIWLYDLLEHHRYLVVIDDVWDLKAWKSLRKALRDKKNGSRILLTTRNKDIALRIDPRSILQELRFLNKEESWKLFWKKAFRPNNNSGGSSSNLPPYLEMVGREMLGYCGGLPLGIIVLGGLLTRTSQSEVIWTKMLNHISQRLMEDQDHHPSQVLALSYHDLPYELRPCFLYTALFPKGFAVEKKKLIQLWMAEGFIPQGKEPMEDIAEVKLKELSDRCMIQVARNKSSWNDEECSCSIHDLLWDLAITKAKEERFLQIYETEDSPPSSARIPNGRRFAIHSPNNHAIHSQNKQSYLILQIRCLPPNLRSLIISNRSPATTEVFQKELKSIFIRFKLLRVLDLDYIKLDREPPFSLPIHLKYLGLKNTCLEVLPTSIGNLQRLQTLDMTSYSICTLPDSVRKLGQLRHLYGCWSKTTPQIDTLTNLRTLDCIDINAWKKNDPSKLINLLELKITGIESSEDMLALSVSLEKMGNNLKSLSVRMDKERYDPLSIELPGCDYLLNLDITCHLTRLPYLLEYTPNLNHLELHYTYLEEDPMQTLEMLENLSVLKLEGAYTGTQMSCSSSGFPQLESLSMSLMFELMGWTIGEGAMPGLRQLCMSCLPALQEVPKGFKYLTALRELHFEDISMAMEEKIRGEESYKVQHIPSVTFSQSNDVSEDKFDQITNLFNFEVLHFLASEL